MSRLDRAFISSPSSLILKLNIGCSVVGTPEESFANGESDHAPLALCFGRCFRPLPRICPSLVGFANIPISSIILIL